MKAYLKGDLLLIIATAIWGISFPLVRNLTSIVNPICIIGVRFSVASIFLALFFMKRTINFDIKTIKASIVNGILLFTSFYILVIGQKYTTALNSSFIMGTTMVTVPILSSLFLRKKPDNKSIIAIGVAFIGMFFITGGVKFSFSFGDLIVFMSMLAFSFHIIVSDKFINNKGIDPIDIGIAQNITAAIISIPFLIMCRGDIFNFNFLTTLQILILGIFCTAIAFTLMIYCQKFIPPSRVGLILGAEPVFGAFFSVVIPDFGGQKEQFLLNHFIGSILILFAIIISESKILSKQKSYDF